MKGQMRFGPVLSSKQDLRELLVPPRPRTVVNVEGMQDRNHLEAEGVSQSKGHRKALCVVLA